MDQSGHAMTPRWEKCFDSGNVFILVVVSKFKSTLHEVCMHHFEMTHLLTGKRRHGLNQVIQLRVAYHQGNSC